MRGAGRAVALAAATLAVLAGGIWLGGHPAKLPESLREHLVGDSAGLNVEASELIEDNYYRAVGSDELANASLQGMVRALRRRHDDRFSNYFSPELERRFNEEISGHFSGIGVEIAAVPRGVRIARVFHHSPAAEAGIVRGEVIVTVDGRSVVGKDPARAALRAKELILGPKGTDVTLDVLSPRAGKARKVRVTRAEIRTPITSTRTERANGRTLGYVRLAIFDEGSHAVLRHAVRKVEREGAEGIVLDLRGNGGGLLEEAVLGASVFLPKDEVVVSTRSRTQGRAVYRTVGDNLPARPLVVLIDRNTASAAEILAAALVDDAGAKAVGTRSYGKGVFQQEIGLSNGGALKLTVGEYFTPSGVNLAGRGIRPEVRARDLPETPRDEALARALAVLATQE
ncbi:MAG TPA: S41 family peptidase [Solirubrobacterales bacterium]|nr:S41 family peptidase [Solirubrobacterales bacterium]